MTHQTILVCAAGRDYVWNARDPVLRAPFAATSLSMHFKNKDGGRPHGHRERTVGKKTYRYYADEGRALRGVWTDCPAMVANTPLRERRTTGYPTQKPLKLLDRIIRASAGARRELVVEPAVCGSRRPPLRAEEPLRAPGVSSSAATWARLARSSRPRGGSESAGITFDLRAEPPGTAASGRASVTPARALSLRA